MDNMEVKISLVGGKLSLSCDGMDIDIAHNLIEMAYLFLTDAMISNGIPLYAERVIN